MLRAALFDMDGLLIDSEPAWRKAYVEAVAERGVAITEEDVRSLAGKRPDEGARHWRETRGIEHVPNDELEAAVVERALDEIRLNGRALPGVRHVIALLDEHGVPMLVASSNTPEVIAAVLTKLDLLKRFSLTHSAVHEEFGKPHPGVFLTAAARLGVEPADCVVFEDSLNGVRAAKGAGMKCVAVPDDVNLADPTFAAEADVVLPSLTEIDWDLLTGLFA